jgi:hypothetical protein
MSLIFIIIKLILFKNTLNILSNQYLLRHEQKMVILRHLLSPLDAKWAIHESRYVYDPLLYSTLEVHLSYAWWVNWYLLFPLDANWSVLICHWIFLTLKQCHRLVVYYCRFKGYSNKWDVLSLNPMIRTEAVNLTEKYSLITHKVFKLVRSQSMKQKVS